MLIFSLLDKILKLHGKTKLEVLNSMAQLKMQH